LTKTLGRIGLVGWIFDSFSKIFKIHFFVSFDFDSDGGAGESQVEWSYLKGATGTSGDS
jgi:hypothetical protein